MRYRRREAEATLRSLMGQFKVVLITGARQVGKTTMLQHVLPGGFRYVTLDDPRAGVLAREDPALFFAANRPPVAIDEVQRAPGLFQQVKFLVDRSDETGLVVLTGSQTFHLMQGVSESLAGRVAVLEMTGMSLRELTGCGGRGPYVPTPGADGARRDPSEDLDLWATIHRGSMPRLMDASVSWDAFYTGYVRTYLERDVRDLIRVKDEESFYRFLVACAARTGGLVNRSDLARDAGVDAKTAQGWLSVLRASGVVRLLRPLWSNAVKRLAKTPKLYFTDTGLACHLLGWNTAQTLRRGRWRATCSRPSSSARSSNRISTPAATPGTCASTGMPASGRSTWSSRRGACCTPSRSRRRRRWTARSRPDSASSTTWATTTSARAPSSARPGSPTP